ncbi:hypothetical protein [Thiococcus pfennigii]|uniref:hypothetical protein n=1 Tax=Thiococcus pfennigii TaxID=1057 RepID=UPI001902E40E|nr:hypothetical protein [Thiococcus pfennigii]MBK1732143.1 hypothetical protein [Thiococcus pfennigii]
MNARDILKISALMAAMGMVVSSGAIAGDSAQQTLNYQVSAINEISVSNASVGTLIVSTATAGLQPDEVDDGGATSYSITTNGTGKKITATISEDMPANMTLSLQAVAPTVGSSEGKVDISSASGENAVDLVTGITQVADNEGNTLTYYLDADVAAGVVASTERTVTLTIEDGS